MPAPAAVRASRHAVTCATLVAAIWLVYAQVAGHAYVNLDDELYVVHNPWVAGGLAWEHVVRAFTSAYEAYWIPLTWVSFMADVTCFGLDAGAQLLVNVALHSVDTLLLYALLVRCTRRWGPSAFVAAAFALHPVHVESVAWVSQRKDVLSALFALLAMHAHVWRVRQPSRVAAGAVLVCFALGVLAKPMVVTLPPVLLLLDVWPLGRVVDRSSLRSVVIEKLPLLAVALAAAAMVVVTQRGAGAVPSLDVVPLGLRVANAVTAYVRYVGMLLWPSGLAAFYPLAPVPAWQAAVAAIVLVAVSLGAVRAARTAPYVLVGWLWYLVMLLPVVGIVQVGGQALADRYLHLPSVGLSIAVAWFVADMRLPRRPLGAVAALLCVGWSVVAWRQVGYWKDSEALFRRAVAVTERNFLAHNNLGEALARRGRLAEAGVHWAEAVRLNPGYPEARNNLGNHLARARRFTEAEVHYRAALARRPGWAPALSNLGTTRARQGDHAGAREYFRQALAADPRNFGAHLGMADVLVLLGRPGEALVHYQAALRLRPDRSDVRGRLESARAQAGSG